MNLLVVILAVIPNFRVQLNGSVSGDLVTEAGAQVVFHASVSGEIRNRSHPDIYRQGLGPDLPGEATAGWLWELTGGAEIVRVVIEISGTAWSSDRLGSRDDTRHALETDGRRELVKVLEQDCPPRVMHCSWTGRTHLSADEVL